MRSIVLCTIMVMSVPIWLGAQTAIAPQSNWLADAVTRNGDTLQLHGHVRIAACAVVTADDATRRGETDVTLSGNVRMTLTNGVDSLATTK